MRWIRYLIFFIITGIIIFSLPSRGWPEDMHMYHHEEVQTSGILEDDTRVVNIKAFRYGFDPDPIVVRVNEKVRLELRSTDVDHGILIKDFDINLAIPADETVSVEFIPQKTGTFRILCSVSCGPGHKGMYGSLVVIK